MALPCSRECILTNSLSKLYSSALVKRISSTGITFYFRRGALDFQIKVVSQPANKPQQSWSLISPPPTPIKHSTNTVKCALCNNENFPPPPHVSMAKGSSESSERKKIGGGQKTCIVGIGLQSSGSQTSSASLQISLAQREIILKTPRTLVYKETRKNTVIAIKICRGGPRLRDSAKNWRNELEILTHLDHVSRVRNADLLSDLTLLTFYYTAC